MADVASTLRGLSLRADEIASRSGISADRVRRILDGAKVTASELRALSRGLKLPMRAFSPRGRLVANQELLARFRSPGVAASEREPTLERMAGFVDASLKVLPPREQMPDWLNHFRLEAGETYEEAERMASQLRRLLYPGQEDDPAIDLPHRLTELDGLLVNHLRNSKYEGASVVAGAYIFVFVSPRFPARMLFTLGHELGHVVAHHSLQAAHLDLASSIGNFRNRSEGFADAFSSAFLLPRTAVGRSLYEIRRVIGAKGDEVGDVEILILARLYGVSFDVAARRCEDLDLLPRGGAASLAEHLRKFYRNPEQRAESLKLPPREQIQFEAISPVLMERVLENISRGVASPSWFSDRLNISIENIYASNASMAAKHANTH